MFSPDSRARRLVGALAVAACGAILCTGLVAVLDQRHPSVFAWRDWTTVGLSAICAFMVAQAESGAAGLALSIVLTGTLSVQQSAGVAAKYPGLPIETTLAVGAGASSTWRAVIFAASVLVGLWHFVETPSPWYGAVLLLTPFAMAVRALIRLLAEKWQFPLKNAREPLIHLSALGAGYFATALAFAIAYNILYLGNPGRAFDFRAFEAKRVATFLDFFCLSVGAISTAGNPVVPVEPLPRLLLAVEHLLGPAWLVAYFSLLWRKIGEPRSKKENGGIE